MVQPCSITPFLFSGKAFDNPDLKDVTISLAGDTYEEKNTIGVET